MKYRVVAPGRGRLTPGAILDGSALENLDSLVRLGVVKPEPVKKPVKKKKPRP